MKKPGQAASGAAVLARIVDDYQLPACSPGPHSDPVLNSNAPLAQGEVTMATLKVAICIGLDGAVVSLVSGFHRGFP